MQHLDNVCSQKPLFKHDEEESLNINVITTALAYIPKHDPLSTGGVHLSSVLQPLQ